MRSRCWRARLLVAVALFCGLVAAGCSSVTGEGSADLDPLATAIPPSPPGSPGVGGADSGASVPAPTSEPSAVATANVIPTEEPDGDPVIDRETRFDGSIAPEASGIVVSRLDPSIYWLIDDGPETTSVVAVSSDGETLGRVTMAGVVGRDTEDIAAGPCGPDDPSPCLFVGDIGDNLGGTWPSIQIHRFPEPDAITTTQVEVATATYTYEDGARDAEALVVDDLGRPVVLSKEEGVVGVYQSTAFADGVLARVAEVELPRPTLGLLTSQVGLHATAADRRPDGTRLLLRTYDSVVELIAPSREAAADLSSVARWRVEEPPAPFEPQGEAIAYLADGIGYVTVSERSNRITVVQR